MANELEPLDLEKTKLVYSVIFKSPGLEFRDLQARTKLNIKDARSCLNRLEARGLITTEKDGSYFRFFPETLSRDEKKTLCFLRQFIVRKILFHLLQNPGSKMDDVARAVHLSNSTLSWHAGKLLEAGILRRSQRGLEVTDPKRIMKLLIAYRESFLDKLVDRFIESWAGR